MEFSKVSLGGTAVRGELAVRLGFHQVKGLKRAVGERIVAARTAGPFVDIADLARRARLERADLDLLADAGAMRGLAGHRRQAAWDAAAVQVQGLAASTKAPSARQADLFAGTAVGRADVTLPAPAEGEEIVADYRRLGLSLGRHPLALLRARLAARRYVAAADLAACGDRAVLKVAGLVTCRQRPGTASGVIFLTLEDETGNANIVVFSDVSARQHQVLLGSRLLGVAGQLQVQGEGEHLVVHLVAKRLFDHSDLLGELRARSRDFH